MKRRKVLYVAPTARGGSAVVLYDLITGLDREQYEPVVLFYVQDQPGIGDKLVESGVKVIALKTQSQTSRSPSTEQTTTNRNIADWLKSHVGRVAGEIYTLAKAGYQFIRWETPKIWPIVRVIRENEIELVHINTGLRHGKPAILAAWLTRTPCLCHIHMFADLNYLDRLLARWVNLFIYISRAIADNYTRQGIPATKGTLVHNAVNFSEFSRSYDPELVYREFGWQGNEFLVGVVGRLDWWKGHEYFLEAMAQALQQQPQLRGLIIGEPETTPRNTAYYHKLQALSKSLGLEDKVVFTGYRSDIAPLIAALDIVVLSSSAPEPFGLVVIEGMAAGKPVVATAAGGPLDIIEDGVNGLLVPCQDAPAMAQAILWILSHPDEAAKIAGAGRRYVAEKCTLEHYVAAIQNIYVCLTPPLKTTPSSATSLENESDRFLATRIP
jgi:glycosyltransferase involved in cell wall biosynthesis